MDSSFFEHRNDTAGADEADSEEVIDNSMVDDESFTVHKTPAKSSQTRFIAESEDSMSSDEDDPDESITKEMVKSSGTIKSHVICSSDKDGSKSGNLGRQSESSSNKLVVSSSSDEEDEASPEIVPRRRPPAKQRALYGRPSDSPLIRRVKKRMILTDTDTDNSIIIDKDNHKKQICLKDTPEKLDVGVKSTDIKPKNMSNMSNMTDDESEPDESEADDSKADGIEDDDAGFEEEMVMSRATRMSIMGVMPQDLGSDESDFILSDESKSRCSSAAGSTHSLDLPDPGISMHKTQLKSSEPNTRSAHDEPKELLDDPKDDSNLTCSSFGSPAQDNDKTNVIGNNENDETKLIGNRNDTPKRTTNKNVSIDLTKQTYMPSPVIEHFKGKLPKNTYSKSENNTSVDLTVNEFDSPVKGGKGVSQVKAADDDVTIIDTKPEIIALSSDDEDEPKPPRKYPSTTSVSPKPSEHEAIQSKQSTLKQYLQPPSYPNAGVIFVKRSVRENELSKLSGLKRDLQDVRYLVDNMDVRTLPDGGAKLVQRLSKLEEDVKRQGEKVAKMVEEPENPSMSQMNGDGFEQGPSWEDLQQASNQVQPRMFGKQAMSTHMAERNMILERLQDLHSSLASRPPDTAVAAPPHAMKTDLMPYQLQALSWLKWRETQKPAGGILADDMGLGKTITTIALIAASKEANIDDDEDDDDDDGWTGKENFNLVRGGTLVVCPASLLQQWAGEVSKHCKSHALSVCLHHGAARATQPRRLAPHDIVVTTYNLLQRDSEKNGVLLRLRWTRVVLDEAHIVRNHKSATSVAVTSLRASRRWCLTGTPVQNKDLDVFALLKFLRCTPFDDLTMWKKWIDNKSAGGQERLSTIMRCLLLRRTKQQLQQKGQLNCLPERELHQVEVKLSMEEMNVYQKVLVLSKTLFAQFLHQRAEKQADGDGFIPRASGKDDPYAKMHQRMVKLQGAKPVKSHEILVLLLRLRQVCCHCGLIGAMLDREDMGEEVSEDPGGVDLLSELNKLSLDEESSRRQSRLPENEEEEPQQEGATATEAIRSVMSANNPVFEMQRMSSKIRAVMDCLNNKVLNNKGHKAVVVSQWTTVLRLVESELKKSGVKSCTLSGQVPVPARPPLIDALNDPNNSTRVMLLSLCAGGVGLNLCGASHLLLLDPHWNPQLEQQAQDRVYRVGQTRAVNIYRFMCVDTVEQSIRKLQDVKLQMAEAVLTGAKNTNASKLTIEDLKMLFNMGPVPE